MKKLLIAMVITSTMPACSDNNQTPAQTSGISGVVSEIKDENKAEEVTIVAEALRENIIVQHLMPMAQNERRVAKRMVLRLASNGWVNLVVSDYTEEDREASDKDAPLGTAYGLQVRNLNDVKNLARTIRGMNKNGRDGEIVVIPRDSVGAYVFNEYSNQSIEANCSADLKVIRVAAQGYMMVTTSCHDLSAIDDGIIFPSKHASVIATLLESMAAEVSS
ncbi:hypothetical protein swp_3222 [Shewanella piezotolerans WP3]|uniref:Lipoprotein n=1 Tax=Shewanella piezotolerans (strain WP3 / JCM 13877) TaxID=225849 RepID=B8CRC0_SHEPW|nr:hypothetical protein [Shewanella piezotolerans]ACJ29928.1 hypothetical protein swp_3222 [Shewanella piezotolerans WP3]